MSLRFGVVWRTEEPCTGRCVAQVWVQQEQQGGCSLLGPYCLDVRLGLIALVQIALHDMPRSAVLLLCTGACAYGFVGVGGGGWYSVREVKKHTPAWHVHWRQGVNTQLACIRW